MSKLPIFSAQALDKILLYLGFQRKRQVGSHVFF
jgi:predicted RNA binding protein YcfA (HicA-like mRNA interferase family)